jgi:hypothetical protein
VATPPLPDNPTIRVRTIFSSGGSGELGSRFYLNYTGGPASGADLTTLAGDIETAYATHLVGLWAVNFTLTEIDCLDITTEMGNSGTWTGTEAGSRTGSTLPDQCCTNVEFDVAERYRGGKPRIYLPPGVSGDLATVSTYSSDFVDLVNTDMALAFAEITGLSVGSLGTLTHVLLSYYKGYNTSTPPWRGPGFKYPPKYRSPNAISMDIKGYACKRIIGSQRRRRTAVTP